MIFERATSTRIIKNYSSLWSIHDNLSDLKNKRSPYFSDLKKGANLFELWRFSRAQKCLGVKNIRWSTGLSLSVWVVYTPQKICHCLSQNMTHRSIKCKISDLLVIIGSLNFLEKGSLGEKYRIILQNKARCEKKGGIREKGRNREGPL